MLRSDAQRNRAQLIRAARDLIAQTGAVDINARDIADRAGVSSATLYRHFESKGELIDEISVDRWRRAAGWARGSGRPDQALIDIVSLLDRFSWMVTADARFIAAAGLQVGRTPYAIRPMRQVFDERFEELWAAARASGQVRPWVHPGDVMDVIGAVRDPARRTPILAMVVAGFSPPDVDVEHLIRMVRASRPARVRL